jgi:hypothetical protein
MIIIYAADIGSIKNGNFAWARLLNDIGQISTDSSIQTLVDAINLDIAQNNKVCLGFECPLFINLPSNPLKLTSARTGEGSRAWSAGAGSGSLTTGLAEVLWVFSELKQKSKKPIIATFEINDLLEGSGNLLVWEAFVSSKSKGNSHYEDAIIAVKKFTEKLNLGVIQTDVTVENPYSLVGAALLRSGVSNDIGVLRNQCIVIKA